VKVIFITWRNEARRKEFSGGNTRREFIYKLILQVLKPSKSIEYGLEYFDSAISKVFAGTAKIVHFLHGPGQLVSYFREMRFKYVNCNNLFKLVDSLDETVIVLDHVRAVMMMSRCMNLLRKSRLLHISHDFVGEFPYAHRLHLSLKKSSLKILSELDPLTIVVSYRDKILYEEAAKLSKVVVFPNIYPPVDEKFEPRVPTKHTDERDILRVVAVKGADRHYSMKLAEFIRLAKKYYVRNMRLTVITSHTPTYEHLGALADGKVAVRVMENIPDRFEFLRVLSEHHIGLIELYGKRGGGTNVRKYDYALAGIVPASLWWNIPGEPINEIPFLDLPDLVAKLTYFAPEELDKRGLENQTRVLEIYRQHFSDVVKELAKLV
jgi:hypothetical protein